MRKSTLFIVVTTVLVAVASQSQAQYHTKDGAVAGGVTGAVIGGIIGHQNDETPEGVLIGGAVGAIAGGLIGNARDQQLAREHYYRQELARQQQVIQAQGQTARRPASVAEVIEMSQNGIGDSVIINHLYANGVDRKLEVRDIIQLHQLGVSENVITQMQRAPIRSPGVSPVMIVERPTTVIVEEHAPHCHAYPRYYQAYPSPPMRSYWR